MFEVSMCCPQFANINAAPIDLSTMSGAGHLQSANLGALNPGHQQVTPFLVKLEQKLS